MRRVAAITGLVILAACAGDIKFTPPAPREIQKTFLYDKPYDAVWQAAIEAIAEMNLPIDNLEKDSGLITISWQNFGAQSASTGFCDCGRINAPSQYSDGEWIPGRPNKEAGGIETETWYVRGHFNIFVKPISESSCELTVNSVFETENHTCVSTGRLEATLDKTIREKVG